MVSPAEFRVNRCAPVSDINQAFFQWTFLLCILLSIIDLSFVFNDVDGILFSPVESPFDLVSCS